MTQSPVSEPVEQHAPPTPPAPESRSQPTAPQPEHQQQIAESLPAERHEVLPTALEPELRKIIDTAVARVAAIELDAIRQARELTQRSENEGREALKFALDRAFQLMNSFELLSITITGMVEALRVELDDAIEGLRHTPEPESELSRELDARGIPLEDVEQHTEDVAEVTPAAVEPAPVEPAAVPPPEPTAEQLAQELLAEDELLAEEEFVAEQEPAAAPAPVVEEPEVHEVAATGAEQSDNGDSASLTEPSPEMTEMFREQIQSMKSSGKSREDAERSLLRFNVGRRLLGLIDEIYPEDAGEAKPSGDGQRKGRMRSFFSR